jgi:parallel beta-helix repeat protein
MHRLHLLLFALLFSFLNGGFAVVHESGGAVIRVPADYPTVQGAIDAAGQGDIILVMVGTYYEHLQINKSLTLIGEDPSTTIIDGNGTGRIVQVDADNVVIDGFTIQNGDFGIFLNSSYNKITNNNVTFNGADGIVLWLSNHDIISNNRVLHNGYYTPGFLSGGGIDLIQSNFSIVSHNFMFGNVQFGVAILGGENNVVTQNVMANSEVGDGVFLVQAIYNNFTQNTVKKNRGSLLLLYNVYGTYGNIFYHNNFIGNYEQIPRGDTPPSANSRNNSLGEGNYWNDYKGEDLDGDLIGDTDIPHLNVDYYPLMIPYGPTIYTFNAPYEEKDYPVTVETDSATATFNFSQPEKQISFNLTCPKYAEGFCNITIPKELLRANATYPWKIMSNGIETEYISMENLTHSFIYFEVNGTTTCTIRILGSEVIPELSPVCMIPIVAAFTLAIVLFRKMTRNRTPPQVSTLVHHTSMKCEEFERVFDSFSAN